MRFVLSGSFLTKPTVHRLVELAEFYQIEGYQSWRRMHQPDTLFGAPASAGVDDDDSDESESNEAYSTLTRAEAVRQFPEAAHQTLAAILGLVYSKIRKEVGEGCLPRATKRNQEEVVSNTPSSRQQKSVKLARGPTKLPSGILQKLVVPGPSSEQKSHISEDSDKLGWDAHLGSPDETGMFRRGFNELHQLLHAHESGVPLNPTALRAVLHGMEEGLYKAKPSPSELQNMSPTERAKYSFHSAGESTIETIPEVPSTEPRTPSPKRERKQLPATASNASTPSR